MKTVSIHFLEVLVYKLTYSRQNPKKLRPETKRQNSRDFTRRAFRVIWDRLTNRLAENPVCILPSLRREVKKQIQNDEKTYGFADSPVWILRAIP